MSILSFFKRHKAMDKLIKEEQEKAKELRMKLLKTANKMAMLDGENHWFLRKNDKIVEDERVSDCVINNRRESDVFKTKCFS